jgi:hypothetical protein
MLLLVIIFNGCTMVESITNNPSITPMKVFAEIPKGKLDAETLVLIDIDNTILRSSTHYGSFEFFTHIVKDEMKNTGCTEAEAKIKVYDRWLKAQLQISTKLIDNKIHQFIKLAKASNATVIAFTGRSPLVSKITHSQINRHNIELDQLPGFAFHKQYVNQLYPEPKWCQEHNDECNTISNKKNYNSQAVFSKGILFAHDLNKKGTVFIDFYNNFSAYKSNIKRVIFVDDGLHNLESLKEATAKLGLKYYGYHITSNYDFDPNLAMEEEAKYNQQQ